MPSPALPSPAQWLPASASQASPAPHVGSGQAPVAAGLAAFGSPDAVALLLENKRSASTRRAYASDLRLFALFLASCDPWSQSAGLASDTAAESGDVERFLQLSAPQIACVLAAWKGAMLRASLSEATINRRLATVRSLLKLAFRLGLSACDGRGLIEGERSRPYRDTRGISLGQLRRLLPLPLHLHGAGSVHGLRDAALLRLLCENVLRRGEAHALDVSDFEPSTLSLLVLGKGAGTQKQRVTLSAATVQVLAEYLEAAGHRRGALFRCLDHRPDKRNGRLTTNGIYKIVRAYGTHIGADSLAPHQLRHAGITAALDATGGDVRRVQKLSRHKNIATLMIYDDSRQNFQSEVTNLLSDLMQPGD